MTRRRHRLHSTRKKEVNVLAVHLPRRHNAKIMSFNASSCEGRPHLLLAEPSLMGHYVAVTTSVLIREDIRLNSVPEYVRY